MEPFPFDSENYDECIIEQHKTFFKAIVTALTKLYVTIVRIPKKTWTALAFVKKGG